MNYIKELNAFRDWSMLNRPSTGQVALWYTLMSINNWTGWQEWFSTPNQTLPLMTGLSRGGLENARSSLIQQGRIQYKKGRSNQAGSYKIIPFLMSDYQKVGTEVSTGTGTPAGTEKADPNAQEKPLSRTLNKQNQTKPNETEKEKQQKEKSLLLATQVEQIWNHYVQVFKSFFPRKLTLTPKRKKAIQARLQEGYSVEEISLAISNIRQSPFHCGQNDGNKFYADIIFICRDGGKVEEWMNHQGGAQHGKLGNDTGANQESEDGVVIQFGKYART
jgi:hypothetical protein